MTPPTPPTPANTPPAANGHGPTPQFVQDDVQLLLAQLTGPEAPVAFSIPNRADPATIQNTIHPPQATWTWHDATARLAQQVDQSDLGKYGLQVDVGTLYQLRTAVPPAWEPVRDFTAATWTWPNRTARESQPVTAQDVGKTGYQADTDTYYRLTGTGPATWQPAPNAAHTSAPFELSTGAADADSFHDFFRLQIAFEDVWSELFDATIEPNGRQLYAVWDALMQAGADDTHEKDRTKRFSSATKADITGVQELKTFLANLKAQLGIATATSATATTPTALTQLRDAVVDTLKGCNMLLTELNRAGSNAAPAWQHGDVWLRSMAGNNDNSQVDDLTDFPGVTRGDVFNSVIRRIQSFAPTPPPPTPSPAPPSVTFPDLTALLAELDRALKERYRFDVFAPASINYGVLLNYRQRWQPQSYQVGNLVSTIPLAPQETRRYTSKTVVSRTRNVKEINDSVRSGKKDTSGTERVDAEIVDRAKNQTSFQTNAAGSYGNDNLYKISAGLQLAQDQAVESAQTKREFHEAVVRSAQEYRSEHRLEISTEERREDESTTFREIRNPNDELTVTYLFYELQRRYLVDESLHKVTPVVLVANDVPAPHEVDQGWILRHDWILKRTILDDSFLPALEYLASDYTGAELALETLGMAVEQQKAVVDRISMQVQAAGQSLDAATLGLQAAESQSVRDQQDAEARALVKSFFDPLNITRTGTVDGNSDRARVDFAKDALSRAQQKVNLLLSDLKGEATALQAAIDRYVAATTQHFSMLAEIDRLRVHVKDNIIYYMQAIWTYEPADQRYFRLYDLDVPVFAHNTTLPVMEGDALSAADPSYRSLRVALPPPTPTDQPMKLHQIADLETLLGFKGNYMIFPVTNFDNYLIWYMLQNYLHVDDVTGVTAVDPEPGADLTIPQLSAALQTIAKNPTLFAEHRAEFEEVMFRLLSRQTPEMVIVPSDALYIEALPGTHPLLEDFKLIHRAIDVKRAQAEARKAELENLRLAARVSQQRLGDPDVDKLVLVEDGQRLSIDPDTP